jgi:vacuolar-type H+-ATPase subunit H
MNDLADLEQSNSHLDQIRQVEIQVIREVDAARKRAEASLRKARNQADQLVRKAVEDGRAQGERDFHEIINKAEVEAKELVGQAVERAEALRHQGELRLKTAVRLAYELVIGSEEETENS